MTVGISRSDEGIIDRPLVQAVLDAGAGRDVLSYRTLKILADLDPAVAAVRGFTRYDIDPEHDTVTIIDRGGISRDLPSRVEGVAPLRGTKHRVASEREVLVGRGRSDGRTLIFVPEVKGGETTGLTLLHVKFHDTRPAEVMRGVLQGYDRRYDRLVDTVTETEGAFDESLLGEIPVRAIAHRPGDRHRRALEALSRWRSSGSGSTSSTSSVSGRSLARTPSMRTRLFTDVELEYVAPKADPVPSLAARFAAREAVMKSLGLGLGAFGFHEVWVERADSGEPSLAIIGRAL